MLVAGLRRQHSFADAVRTIPLQWEAFRALPPLPGAVAGATYGVICGAAADGFEYMSGIEVRDFSGLPADLGRMRIPAQRYAVFEHRGHVSGIQSLWQQAMDDWLPRSGFRSAHRPDFER
jgi:AraC family transcriptional regulator